MTDDKNKVYQAFKEAAKELIEQAGEGDKMHLMRDPKDGTAAFLEAKDGTEEGIFIENDSVKPYRKPPMIAKLFNDQGDQVEKKDSGHYHFDEEKRRAIAHEFREKNKRGRVTQEEFAALKGISDRTLRSYLKAFPET